MNDHDLDTMIRSTLQHHAVDVQPDPQAWTRIAERIEHGDIVELRAADRGQARVPLFLLAAAVIALIGLIGALLVIDDDASVRVGPSDRTPDASAGNGTPEWFDPTSAAPVFQSRIDDPDAAAGAYLRSRFPDFPRPNIVVSPATVDGGLAQVRWRTGEDGGSLIASGTVHLRHDVQENEWEVVGAFIDQVLMETVANDGTGAVVTGRNRSGQPAQIDARDGGDNSILEGARDLEDRFARRLVIVDGPIIVRIELVGGTVLGVAELRLDPPASYPIWPAFGFEAQTDIQRAADEDGGLPPTDVDTATRFAHDALGYSTATVTANEESPEFSIVTLTVDGGGQLVVDLARVARPGSLWYVTAASSPGFAAFVEGSEVTLSTPANGQAGFRAAAPIATAGSLAHPNPIVGGAEGGSTFPLATYPRPFLMQAELLGDDGTLFVFVGIVR